MRFTATPRTWWWSWWLRRKWRPPNAHLRRRVFLVHWPGRQHMTDHDLLSRLSQRLSSKVISIEALLGLRVGLFRGRCPFRCPPPIRLAASCQSPSPDSCNASSFIVAQSCWPRFASSRRVRRAGAARRIACASCNLPPARPEICSVPAYTDPGGRRYCDSAGHAVSDPCGSWIVIRD